MTTEYGNSGTNSLETAIRPSRKLRLLYNLYLILIIWFLAIPGLILLSLFISPLAMIIVSFSVLAIALLAIALIRKYYDSLSVLLGTDSMEVRSGLPGNKYTIIPYTRVAVIEIVRHRIAGYIGLSSLKISYSAVEGISGEVMIRGIEDPDTLRTRILDLVATAKMAINHN